MSGFRERTDELIAEYRETALASLDGLSEDEARAKLVPSKTTLLGLVKHLTYVEGIWFDQAITGRKESEIGIASSPDRSFTLTKSDTVASISAGYRERIAASKANVDDLDEDLVVDGRGERTVSSLLLQVLRELAHHAGHADILREQVLAARPSTGSGQRKRDSAEVDD